MERDAPRVPMLKSGRRAEPRVQGRAKARLASALDAGEHGGTGLALMLAVNNRTSSRRSWSGTTTKTAAAGWARAPRSASSSPAPSAIIVRVSAWTRRCVSGASAPSRATSPAISAAADAARAPRPRTRFRIATTLGHQRRSGRRLCARAELVDCRSPACAGHARRHHTGLEVAETRIVRRGVGTIPPIDVFTL